MKWSRSHPGVSDRNYDNNIHVHVFSACSTYRNYDNNVYVVCTRMSLDKIVKIELFYIYRVHVHVWSFIM